IARTSVPRSRNSCATSWIAGSDSVTRTKPSSPTTSASRRARSPPPLRFCEACGLTTTPMPGTSGGRQLSAGRLDVPPATLANRGVDAVRAETCLESLDAIARARREAAPGKGIERDQVHLRAESVQQPYEAARIGVGVVLAREHHVLEGDALAPRQRERAARREQCRERIAAVDRHQPGALRVGRRAERYGEVDPRLGDQARDGGHEPDRRDGDPSRRE